MEINFQLHQNLPNSIIEFIRSQFPQIERQMWSRKYIFWIYSFVNGICIKVAFNPAKRTESLYLLQERAHNDRRFLSSVYFTDECTLIKKLKLNYVSNVQNRGHKAQENRPTFNISSKNIFWPRSLHDNHTIRLCKIDENLNSEKQ